MALTTVALDAGIAQQMCITLPGFISWTQKFDRSDYPFVHFIAVTWKDLYDIFLYGTGISVGQSGADVMVSAYCFIVSRVYLDVHLIFPNSEGNLSSFRSLLG